MARLAWSAQPLKKRIAGTGISVLSVALLTTVTQLVPAQAAEPEPAPDMPMVDPVVTIDSEAVAEAADRFVPGNAADAAALAEAAAMQHAVPVKKTAGGMIAETDTAIVAVDRSGEVMISAEGMPEIGIAVEGDPETVKVVDGAVVQTEVAPSTDVVTRATDEGVQMIAILGDEEAPGEVEFPLDLPGGDELVVQADGSIVVLPDLEALVPSSDEGSVSDADDISVKAALIEPAWAADANGEPVETEYVIDGHTITQVIRTDEDTVFPASCLTSS